MRIFFGKDFLTPFLFSSLVYGQLNQSIISSWRNSVNQPYPDVRNLRFGDHFVQFNLLGKLLNVFGNLSLWFFLFCFCFMFCLCFLFLFSKYRYCSQRCRKLSTVIEKKFKELIFKAIFLWKINSSPGFIKTTFMLKNLNY